MEKQPARRASHARRNILISICAIIFLCVVFWLTSDTKDAAASSAPAQSAPPHDSAAAHPQLQPNPHVDALPESVQRDLYIHIMAAERKGMAETNSMDDAAGDKRYSQIVDAAERKDKLKYHLNDDDMWNLKIKGSALHWPAKSQEVLKDEREVQLAKAACHEVYVDTSSKRQRDLTVEEADQVDSCRAAGLYR